MMRKLLLMLLLLLPACACSSELFVHNVEIEVDQMTRSGYLLMQDGKHQEAIELGTEALALAMREYGENHASTARCFNALGVFHAAAMDFGQAEAFYLKAADTWRRVSGPARPELAESLHNVALIYDQQRRLPEAEDALLRALAIRERLKGSEDKSVGENLGSLAVVYARQGKYEEAGQAFLRSTTILEKALGEQNPSFAMSLANLAKFYGTQGRDADARETYRRALSILENAVGSDHPAFLSVQQQSIRVPDEFDVIYEQAQSTRPDLQVTESFFIVAEERALLGPSEYQSVGHIANYLADHFSLYTRVQSEVIRPFCSAQGVEVEPFLDALATAQAQEAAATSKAYERLGITYARTWDRQKPRAIAMTDTLVERAEITVGVGAGALCAHLSSQPAEAATSLSYSRVHASRAEILKAVINQ